MVASNNPPHTVLELDKEETKWLHALLAKTHVSAQETFSEICGMSSSDPRAKMRSTLMMTLNADEVVADDMATRLEKQDRKLKRPTKGETS